MQKIEADLRFQCPFGCMVVGPSMSGKSHFILELLKKRDQFFSPPPTRVVYAYGIWQQAFEAVHDIEFVKGVKGLAGVDFNPGQPSILVIDDLMEELSNNKELSTLFTREMHHKNISLFLSPKPVQTGQEYARCGAELSGINTVQVSERHWADKGIGQANGNKAVGTSLPGGYKGKVRLTYCKPTASS